MEKIECDERASEVCERTNKRTKEKEREKQKEVMRCAKISLLYYYFVKHAKTAMKTNKTERIDGKNGTEREGKQKN